jgi:hypothetical protein
MEIKSLRANQRNQENHNSPDIREANAAAVNPRTRIAVGAL